MTSPLGLSSGLDAQRLSEEVIALRSKLSSYEETWNQAKPAFEAWKREANEQSEKSKTLDRERIQLQIKLANVCLIYITFLLLYHLSLIYPHFFVSFCHICNPFVTSTLNELLEGM